jgi:hypothetical protein
MSHPDEASRPIVEGEGAFILEVCKQLRSACFQYTIRCFQPLHEMCLDKGAMRMAPGRQEILFAHCLKQVRWDDEDVRVHEERAFNEQPNVAHVFSRSFIEFVKLSCADADDTVTVRLTIPVLPMFIRGYQKAMFNIPKFVSGDFFARDALVSDQMHVVEHAIRIAMMDLMTFHVVIEQPNYTDPQSVMDDIEQPNYTDPQSVMDDIEPDDSASNIGGSDVSKKSRFHIGGSDVSKKSRFQVSLETTPAPLVALPVQPVAAPPSVPPAIAPPVAPPSSTPPPA